MKKMHLLKTFKLDFQVFNKSKYKEATWYNIPGIIIFSILLSNNSSSLQLWLLNWNSITEGELSEYGNFKKLSI